MCFTLVVSSYFFTPWTKVQIYHFSINRQFLFLDTTMVCRNWTCDHLVSREQPSQLSLSLSLSPLEASRSPSFSLSLHPLKAARFYSLTTILVLLFSILDPRCLPMVDTTSNTLFNKWYQSIVDKTSYKVHNNKLIICYKAYTLIEGKKKKSMKFMNNNKKK